MYDDFTDEELEITELPEREEMLTLPFGLGSIGLDLAVILGL